MSPLRRMAAVTVFATAMGYFEAAVVYYLRTLVHRIDPYQADPLPNIPALAGAELVREFSTLLMLAMVGCLAGKTWRGRIGFGLIAFGIWDLTYYLFLIPLTGWPRSILDWDILFLIPLPWWGPVITPVSIAFLLIAFGVFATVLELAEPPVWPCRLSVVVCALGIAIALLVFMKDAIALLPQGEAALRKNLPQHFDWAFFGIAWVMMFVPVGDMGWQLATRYR